MNKNFKKSDRYNFLAKNKEHLVTAKIAYMEITQP